MTNVACPLCTGKKSAPIFHDFGYDQNEYDIVRCSSCAFWYLNPQPSDQELEKIYASYYGTVESHLDFRKTVFEDLISFLEPRRKNFSESDISPTVKSAPTLVDIGCGNGDFIHLAQKHGWSVGGAEISTHAVEFATSERGLNVIKSNLEELPFESSSFDVVTILDVLEHLRDPRKTLTEIFRILKPGGLIVIRVPNTPFQFLKARLQRLRHGSRFTTMATPLHLNHFDAASLGHAVTQAGFTIQKLCPAAADGSGAFGLIKRCYTHLSQVVWRGCGAQIGNILFLAAVKK
jgi:2-polyprenyl-3-methyl-5-hydroxy-6-metoxy-1,4-benzoquinol methylase